MTTFRLREEPGRLTRRQFLRAAGACALGIAGAGLLAGCSESGSQSGSSGGSKLATIQSRGTL